VRRSKSTERRIHGQGLRNVTASLCQFRQRTRLEAPVPHQFETQLLFGAHIRHGAYALEGHPSPDLLAPCLLFRS
jgi:hypothetical protein